MFKLNTLLSFGRSRRIETALLLGFVALVVLVGLSAWSSAAKPSRFVDDSVQSLQAAIGDVTVPESGQPAYQSQLAAVTTQLSTLKSDVVQSLALTATLAVIALAF